MDAQKRAGRNGTVCLVFAAALFALALAAPSAAGAEEQATEGALPQAPLPEIVFDASDLEASAELGDAGELFAGYVARTYGIGADGASAFGPGADPDDGLSLRDRKSTRLNSSHPTTSRMPSSA